jgi:glycosyltransferase involved in cell wall biosynthesis
VLVVGEGPDEAALRESARGFGIRSTFTGKRADVPEVLSAADVSVHLSAAEGFSNSVVEALACGLPVIASRAHSHVEQVADGVTGRLVPPGDVAALCEALIEYADPEVRRRAGAAARESAEARLGLDRMIAAYADVLRGAFGDAGLTRQRPG